MFFNLFLRRNERKKWIIYFVFFLLLLYLYISFIFLADKQEELKKDENVVNFDDKEQVFQFRLNRFIKEKNRIIDSDAPGEWGKGVKLSPEEEEEAKKIFKIETYNVLASKKIAMNRKVPDIRHPDCKQKLYPKDLPSASVVIIFCDEAPSGVLRTIHSVVNRSPPSYLHEVVLVDDFSERSDLKFSFESEIKKTWPDKIVKLYRTPRRMGLIGAKVFGAKKAEGDVIVFLDAHCEAGEEWLEPILSRIKEKPKTIVCPAIDLISDENLEYSRNGGIAVGGFTWSLHFTWRGIPEKEKLIRKSDADPVRSPTMAGGLLAADRKFFFHIGAYDEGMFTWGGENLELSFRTWMCGGEVEFVPCSRVGHIFRSSHPYKFDHNDSHGYNSKRLAEVWMDDYKKLFYNHRRDLKNEDCGDLSERKRLRKDLKCNDFKWYLSNVFPEQFIIEENSQAYGMVMNKEKNLCLDLLSRNKYKNDSFVGLFQCSGGISSNQRFGLSKSNELRTEEVCLDVIGKNGVKVPFTDCHGMGGNQAWTYDKISNQIKHMSGYCLDIEGLGGGSDVLLKNCLSSSSSQKWHFEYVNGFI